MYRLLIIAILLGVISCSSGSEHIYSKGYQSIANEKVELSSIKKNRFNVFIAFANNCPVCKASIPTLIKLKEKYKDVGLVLFYPANQKDKQINQFIQDLVPDDTYCVKDKNKYITNYLGATVTPHAFILDSAGNVVYKGAINNGVFTNYRKNYTKQESFLLNALDTLNTQNKNLINHETKVVGCYIE